MKTNIFDSMPSWMITMIIILALWEIVWKFIAMWKSARRSQKAWFIILGVFNTVGILPIIYLLITRDNSIQKTTN
jgi:predicted permease